MQQAKESIKFFRNIDNDDREAIDAEVERLKCRMNADDRMKDWHDLKNMLLRNPGKKALIIGFGLYMIESFTGHFVLMNYTASIFKYAGSALPPNESALIVASVQFIGNLCVPVLVELTGRKVILTALDAFPF